MRAFPVRVPSDARYWTVIDSDLQVVPVVDQWLRHLRFGRSRAELTTKAYAEGAATMLTSDPLGARQPAEASRDHRLRAHVRRGSQGHPSPHWFTGLAPDPRRPATDLNCVRGTTWD